MINKSLNHGGHGRSVTNWCNPFTGPPVIINMRINNHTDGQHWIRHAYALPVRKLFDYIKG